MPHVVQLEKINTVQLSFHDWPSGLNLLALRHVTLINNLITLKNFSSFPPNIHSIQILLFGHRPNFDLSNWSMLRSLSSLSMLTSLHIVINDSNTGLDDINCQIIAETILRLVHFGICFRRKSGMPLRDPISPCIEPDPALIAFINNNPDVPIMDDLVGVDLETAESIFGTHQASITKLHDYILRLSPHIKPLIVVEEEGCGLTVWF